MTRMLSVLLASVVFSIFIVSPSHAGKLDSFEESVEEEPDWGSRRSSGSNESSCQPNELDLGCMMLDFVSSLVSHMVVFGGTHSFYRVDASSHSFLASEKGRLEGVQPRALGEPLIPFVRLDLGYQYIGSNLDGFDYRFETGYGPLALSYSQTRYKESGPDDSLKLTSVHGAYRMSFGPYVELDLGIGSLKVDGNEKNSYLYFTAPFLVHSSRKVGFEFRPSWAGNITGYDVSVLRKFEYVALKIGYRSLKADTESLSGPYVGISAHY